MRRDAAERRRILVVHLTTPHITIGCSLGRRNPIEPIPAWPIAQFHIGAKLAIAPAIELGIERLSGGILDREAEQHESRVAVERLRSRRIVERLFTNRELD